MLAVLKKLTRGKLKYGVRLGVVNSCMIIAAIAVSAILVYASFQAIEGYHSMRDVTERYITCQQDAQLFQTGSDYLTNECRYFAVTGDIIHVRNYVDEIEVIRRRQMAVEEIGTYMTEEVASGYLAKAMEYSGALEETECYAMRLLADAHGCELSELPERIAEIRLEEKDAALSAEEKLVTAMDMLYGDAYQEHKDSIYECVENSVNVLIDEARAQQIDSLDRLNRLLRRQAALVGVLLVILFAVAMGTYVLIIRPLRRAVQHIKNQQQIPMAGAYEMQFLASTYNDMFEQHTRNKEELTYTATHDSVTGLYNRTAFDSVYRTYDERSIAVLMVDVDMFKDFNDRYGHDMGDRVLRRVAEVLRSSFRSEDFVARVGGDEFCTIMMNANSGMRELVISKMRRANERLAQAEDGLPEISISVGIAFGDRPSPVNDVFKDADAALYRVKRNGRGGCEVF